MTKPRINLDKLTQWRGGKNKLAQCRGLCGEKPLTRAQLCNQKTTNMLLQEWNTYHIMLRYKHFINSVRDMYTKHTVHIYCINVQYYSTV